MPRSFDYLAIIKLYKEDRILENYSKIIYSFENFQDFTKYESAT